MSTLTLQLFGFLQREASSVSELRAAIEIFDAAPFTRVLRHNLRSHEERMRLLTSKIGQLGGVVEPVPVLEGAPELVAPLGLLATMTALVASEHRDERMYQRALVDVDAVTRPFLRWLLSEQSDSHLSAVDLHAMVGLAPPRREVRMVHPAVLSPLEAGTSELPALALCRLGACDGDGPSVYGLPTYL